MRTPIYQIDAFANCVFSGNPAAVMPMKAFPTDAAMQAIAAENNLSETAFLIPEGADYRLRWFTPKLEVPLCGHATLASAAVVMERLEPGREQVIFHTASGALTVRRGGIGYVMNFPSRPSTPVATAPDMVKALGAMPCEILGNSFNYMAVLEDSQCVRSLTPDLAAVARLDRPGLIVTGPDQSEYDFVSRYFAPSKGIPEDPVTGAAHCMLVPYWAKRLGKARFRACQASKRGGTLVCQLVGDQVELEGECVFYLEGEAEIESPRRDAN